MHDDITDSIMLANKARNEIRTNAMYINPAQRTIQPKFGIL